MNYPIGHKFQCGCAISAIVDAKEAFTLCKFHADRVKKKGAE